MVYLHKAQLHTYMSSNAFICSVLNWERRQEKSIAAGICPLSGFHHPQITNTIVELNVGEKGQSCTSLIKSQLGGDGEKSCFGSVFDNRFLKRAHFKRSLRNTNCLTGVHTDIFPASKTFHRTSGYLRKRLRVCLHGLIAVWKVSKINSKCNT